MTGIGTQPFILAEGLMELQATAQELQQVFQQLSSRMRALAYHLQCLEHLAKRLSLLHDVRVVEVRGLTTTFEDKALIDLYTLIRLLALTTSTTTTLTLVSDYSDYDYTIPLAGTGGNYSHSQSLAASTSR